MAHKFHALVGESSTTTGTGNFTVSGALEGHRTLASLLSVNDTFDYMIRAFDGDWESGVGTYTAANQFARTTVKESSNAGSLVNFAAGNKWVIMVPTAERMDRALYGGKEELYFPAVSMTPATTNGAASGSVETTTNKVMIETLDFDASADEYAQFSFRAPKNWNLSTLTFVPVWSHPSTATNFGVAWAIQAVAIGNDDAMDAAFGAAAVVTDDGGTTDDAYVGAESASVTVAGTPAEGDLIVVQVFRDVSDAGDDLAVDARLHGITLYLTTNAPTSD